MRTPEEIARMKRALKKSRSTLPEYSMFNDPNHEKINMQLDILSGRISDEDEVYDAEEENGWPEGTASDIRMIFDWLEGDCDPDEITDEWDEVE